MENLAYKEAETGISNLKKIEKFGWYSTKELQDIGVYETGIEEKCISKDNGNEKLFFGGSLIGHLKRAHNQPFNEDDKIDLISLASALETPYVLRLAKENPALIAERNINGSKISYVLLQDINHFKNIRASKQGLEESEKKEMISTMPKLKISLFELKYISDHRFSPVSEISQVLNIPNSVIESAMYKFGFRGLPSKDYLEHLNGLITDIQSSTNRLWEKEEIDILRKKYCISDDFELSKELKRNAETIQQKALELGLEKLKPERKYNILEIMNLTDLSYEEINGHINSKELDAGVFRRTKSEYAEMPVQCSVFVSGKSLIDFLKSDEKKPLPETRRLKYERLVAEKSPNYTLSNVEGRMKACPTLSPGIEKEILEKVKEGDMLARENLIEGNYKLAASMAGRFAQKRRHCLTYSDLFQEGCAGIIYAAEKYDFRKNHAGKRNKFSSVAVWWIMQAMNRAITEKGHTVRKPNNFSSMSRKIEKVTEYYIQNRNREPTVDEVHKKTGISRRMIGLVRKIAKESEIISLDMRIGDDEDSDLYSFIPAGNTEKEVIEKMDQQEILSGVLERMKNVLTVREYIIIKKRHGLDGNNQTLQEVGESIGLTRERIRQLEKSAKKKLSKDASIKKMLINRYE